MSILSPKNASESNEDDKKVLLASLSQNEFLINSESVPEANGDDKLALNVDFEPIYSKKCSQCK